MAIYRELIDAIREFFAITEEMFGLTRNSEYRDISPDVVAEASRKKEELRSAMVNARTQFFLFFATFPIVISICG